MTTMMTMMTTMRMTMKSRETATSGARIAPHRSQVTDTSHSSCAPATTTTTTTTTAATTMTTMTSLTTRHSLDSPPASPPPPASAPAPRAARTDVRSWSLAARRTGTRDVPIARTSRAVQSRPAMPTAQSRPGHRGVDASSKVARVSRQRRCWPPRLRVRSRAYPRFRPHQRHGPADLRGSSSAPSRPLRRG